jgi:hypothetical protein
MERVKVNRTSFTIKLILLFSPTSNDDKTYNGLIVNWKVGAILPRISTCCYMFGSSYGCIVLMKALQMTIIPIESIYLHHISKPNGNELSSFGENTRIVKG